jgi:cytochrome c oxidase subunit II
LWGGVIIPIPILLIVLIYTLFVGEATTLSGRVLGADVEPNVTIDVIGHQFWWEVRYLQEDVVTANEIHIPVGEPVLIRLVSADVIHSFWVPQLHGKIDLVPGTTNTIRLQADEPGVFRGICAEFCGAQHAHMHFLIIAQPQTEFLAWLEHQRQPAAQPADALIEQGQQVFFGAACVYCHAIRGVTAEPVTTIGPDLTHVASRRTLAAGMIENNRGNLGGWILDPQGIKPGNRMPSTRMNSEEFHALLSYMESLR